MLASKDPQKGFFDDYVYGNLIPQDHEIQAIAQSVDFSFVEEKAHRPQPDPRGGFAP